jgi:hypothetical protein
MFGILLVLAFIAILAFGIIKKPFPLTSFVRQGRVAKLDRSSHRRPRMPRCRPRTHTAARSPLTTRSPKAARLAERTITDFERGASTMLAPNKGRALA